MARLILIQLLRSLILIPLLLLSLEVQSQRPNVIYIMTDDMGYGDLSGYGQKNYQTPNLDLLATQGMKFKNAYSAAPVCTPTRVAFMTGRYPARVPVGLLEPLKSTKKDSAFGLSPEYPSIATLMKTGGYKTALVGKWHLGFLPEHRPTKNGFDYFFGFLSGADDYVSHKGTGRVHDLFENEEPVYPKGYLTDLIAQKAVSFIKQKHEKPFFLAVTFNAPHWPWQGPADQPYADSVNLRDGGSRAIYAEMMKSLDEAIGDIMSALDAEHLSNETIVIFTNDNGGERYSDNGGLSNSKMSLWEGGIRVPAFVRWPGKIKAGAISDQVIVTMDWFPTILSIGGVKANNSIPSDGINLVPVLMSHTKTITRTIYWRIFQHRNQKAVRMAEWKYLQDEKGEYLFNLADDQGEKNDLKDKHEEIFRQLKKKYSEWEKTMLQPLPL